jgi:hypothetical protein
MTEPDPKTSDTDPLVSDQAASDEALGSGPIPAELAIDFAADSLDSLVHRWLASCDDPEKSDPVVREMVRRSLAETIARLPKGSPAAGPLQQLVDEWATFGGLAVDQDAALRFAELATKAIRELWELAGDGTSELLRSSSCLPASRWACCSIRAAASCGGSGGSSDSR